MLAKLIAPFLWLKPLLDRIGVCGIAGVIAGSAAGLMLTLLDLLHEHMLVLDPVERIRVALALTLFAWLWVLFVFVCLARYRLSSVVVPTFLNALIVCLLTVQIAHLLGLYWLAWLIGLLVGLLVGMLLCAFYKRFGG
jgi:hypothetical protein